MHFVLIAVFMTANTYSGVKGFSFQEFDSKETCEAAIVSAKQMASKVRGENEFRLLCIKK